VPIIRIADKLVYFAHVPRAAGTAVERYLRARFGLLAFADSQYLSLGDAAWTRSSPQHIPVAALERLFPQGFFDASFAVVRNPATRLRSVFLRQRDIEGALPPDTNFHDWLEGLPVNSAEIDNHSLPMVDFIPEGAKIFHLEDGLQPVIEWLDALAGNRDGPREIAMVNSHEQRLHKAVAPGLAPPQLDDTAKALIAERYGADVVRFGYKAALEPEVKVQPQRTVILHYHLFKNAGTSLDQILKRNFGDAWVTHEFPMKSETNTSQIEDWIRDTPEAQVFSTHTAVGPLPQIEGVRIVSVMLLRDPIERIRSAYRFERRQEADTWGAKLAKEQDFEGYVRKRLARSGDRQCRNFQTHRLATMEPGNAPELERAIAAAKQITALGSVADFDALLRDLAAEITDLCPSFTWEATRANISQVTPDSELPNPDLDALLEDANADDFALMALLWEKNRA